MSQAGIWTLDIAAAPESIATSHIEFSPEHGGLSSHESIIGVDRRVPALASDFMDNGRYRSVVKIQARFGDAARGTSVWMMGTGWLIQPDLLVTAGHVVYDWSKRLGEAREIRCYIGYNGRASIGESYVQSRSAKKIVTTSEWLADTPDRARTKDLAFIQVDRPFTGNLQLFSYVNTPASAQAANIGIVGYPGDKYLRDDERGDDEAGAQMYEEFQYTDYDIARSNRNMIEYRVSTFGGQSGAPIIRRGNNIVAIGTHCYGGGGYEANSGNSIGGKYGNVYQNYISLFSRSVPAKNGSATIVSLQDAKPLNGQLPNGNTAPINFNSNGFTSTGFVQPFNGGRSNSAPSVGDAEGFLDILRAVGKAGSVALPIAGSILGGPIGGGIATVAGSLLGYVSRAESALDSGVSSAESFAVERIAPGAAERAVLAEAALQTVVSLDRGAVAEGLINDILGNFKRTAPKLDGLVTCFRPMLSQHAIAIALQGMNRTAGLTVSAAESGASRDRVPLRVDDLPESAFVGEGGALLECLMAPTLPVAGEEGWLSGLGSIITTGGRFIAPIAGNLAKEYAPKIIGGIVGKITGGAEGAEIPEASMLSDETTRFLFKRALLADASLTALQRLDKGQLRQLRIRGEIADEHNLGDQEGAWGDFFKGVVQTVAPIALNGAQKAAAALAPKVMNAALGKLGLGGRSEGAPANGPVTTTTNGGGARGPGLRKSPSILDMFNGPSTGGSAVQVSSLAFAPGEAPSQISFLSSSSSLQATLDARRAEWQPLAERRLSLDDNDDLPVEYPAPPMDM